MTTAQLKAKRAELRALGVNLREFSEERGVSYYAIRATLMGHNKGERGESHRAAIALGLKPHPKSLGLSIDRIGDQP